MYRLSPSDFKYLWEDCKHCYYQKVKLGIAPPSTPFPAVFTRMNTLLQNSIMGMNLQTINSGLPSGLIEVKEGYLKSKPVPGALDCFISGRFDVLTRLDDGTYTVIDFKITEPKEDQIRKFSSQLHAYKFALENPIIGEPKKISKMGLIAVSPNEIAFNEGHVVFKTKPHWFPIEEDMKSFYELIANISSVLNGRLPMPSESCYLCTYRARFQVATAPTEDIPF